MSKKVTIREVAEAAGVSISTVHQALNGKHGVSEASRARVIRVAEEMGYQPNSMASSLKRKTRYIAVLLPDEKGSNRLYYPPVWNGVRDYLASAPDMNLESIMLPCSERELQEEPEKLARVLQELLEEGRLDGLLTVGHLDIFSGEEWDALHEAGVAVGLINSDRPMTRRMCVVQPNFDVIGRTMAELILSRIPCYGSILLCCGNPEWDAHSLVVRGFEDYMKENGACNRIYRDYSYDMEETSYRSIREKLGNPDIAACCSVLSQSSVLLSRALAESGKADRVFAVGSDLSEESIEALRSGIFDNLIQKNPYAQGYMAVKILAEYLGLGKTPEQDVYYVGSEVIFRSNLPMLSSAGNRPLLL